MTSRKKIKISYQFRRVTAIKFSFDTKCSHLGTNQGLSAALIAVDKVLDLLLFGGLLYFMTDNDKDEPKIYNMKFNID